MLHTQHTGLHMSSYVRVFSPSCMIHYVEHVNVCTCLGVSYLYVCNTRVFFINYNILALSVLLICFLLSPF